MKQNYCFPELWGIGPYIPYLPTGFVLHSYLCSRPTQLYCYFFHLLSLLLTQWRLSCCSRSSNWNSEGSEADNVRSQRQAGQLSPKARVWGKRWFAKQGLHLWNELLILCPWGFRKPGTARLVLGICCLSALLGQFDLALIRNQFGWNERC